MTRRRSRIRSLPILVAAAVIGPAVGCGGDGPPTSETYVRLGCVQCHGAHREGTRTAPPLTGLASRWTEADLVAYLRDPQGVTHDKPRIELRNEQYPLKMPSFAAVPEDELKRLARLLLSD